MFGTILLAVAALMHLYVFWRAASVPLLAAVPRPLLFGAGVLLWLLLAVSRTWAHGSSGSLAAALELAGMSWLTIVFLAFVLLLAADVATGFGLFLPRAAPVLRGLALAACAVLSAVAVIQGLRPPVVSEHEVVLPGLPADMDSTVVVGLSDLHVGSVLGPDWLAARVRQVAAEQPDLVVLLGDILEGHGAAEAEVAPVLRGLHAPLGVFAVPGNHERYRGLDANGRTTLDVLEASGVRVLVNRWAEVRPGLVLAGVEDLTVAARRARQGNPGSPAKDAEAAGLESSSPPSPVLLALERRPPGAAVLLSHSPLRAEEAAGAGAGLMLSGHTHAGQVWPFGWIVRRFYPLFHGRYDVSGMAAIVSRGAGTWGPRMRLWQRGEILKITLRSPEAGNGAAPPKSP